MNAEQLERLYATMKASGEMTPAALRRWRSTNQLTPDPELASAPDPARRADGLTLEALAKVVAPVPVPFPTSVSRPRRPRPANRAARCTPAAKSNAAARPFPAPDARSRWDLLEVD